MSQRLNQAEGQSTLEERLAALKERITQKRMEAMALFLELLAQYKEQVVGKDVPAHISQQLAVMKEAFRMAGVEAGQEIAYAQLEEICARLAIEDVIKAIESLSTKEDKKAQILAEKFREDLKKQISMRLTAEQQEGAKNWRHHVQAKDLIQVLHQPAYVGSTKDFGGPAGLVEKSLNLAENFANMIEKIRPESFEKQQNTQVPERDGQGR